MASTEMDLQELKDRSEKDLTTRFTDPYLEIKLSEAIALIIAECPTVPARLASGALDPINYKRIVADVVFRVTRNPAGYASETEAGVGYQLRPTVASGDLWLSDRDIATLTGIRKRQSALPGTVSLGVDAGWSS